MKLKQISFIGLVLLSCFCTTQINAIFARTTTQYQFYRLSDYPSDDRRPKLAINDQGIVWVVWESDRDGDFDIYGKRFENGHWSDLIEVAQDTNTTTLCDILFYTADSLFIFGTETNLKNLPYGTVNVRGPLFCHEYVSDSLSEREFISLVDHHLPKDIISRSQYYPDNLPKAILLNCSLLLCYHRGTEFGFINDWIDSLFIKSYKNEWDNEKCDTVLYSLNNAGYTSVFHFPLQKIFLRSIGIFLLNYYYDWPNSPYFLRNENFGLIIDEFFDTKYVTLNSKEGNAKRYKTGVSVYNYGSDNKSIFYAGYLIDKNKDVIRRTKSNIDSLAIIEKEWQLPLTSNLCISQMSDLVAFVWSDSANIYFKTLQDSTWYETLEIPLNGLTHIENSLNCAVYNNQQIWIAFDAIYNGNKDVYALSVPASFVVDTVMTSVKQSSENNTFPNDFALFQNYPNPFNSNTEIKYQLPAATGVKLEIYNLLGQRIRTLVDQFQKPGSYAVGWDGTDDVSHAVASGVYLYQLKTKRSVKMNKLILLR